MAEFRTLTSTARPAVEVNQVLRNTYLLLAFTVAFACVTGTVAAALNVPFFGGTFGFILYLVGFFGLSYLVNKTANSVWGLFWTFMFTGFIGFAAGPIVNYYLAVHPGVVAQALGVTAATFFGLSLYTITTKKDFSFLSSFLVIGFFVVIGVIICSFFFDLSAFAAAISGMMVLIACALMLWQTSAIVLGGETNYIIATNNLFVSIYLLFMNLLHLFGIMGGDE
ncbi:MAG: Bax inhibitor-1 family protein [Gammaproteobacteria bacterium]|nr:Bax inhibitor-1 family protein [Gammaproteobacteria bacterium]